MLSAPRYTVKELADGGILKVEDGNHGEYRPRKNEFIASGVAFIRAADLTDSGIDFDSASKINEIARQRITKGIGQPRDVILSHKGTVGKVAIASQNAPPFVCSPQTTFWRSLNHQVLDQDFLYAFLRSPDFKAQLDSRSGETDMAGYVSLTAQRTFWVPLPTIDAQREIVSCISSIDRKIELNRRMNETLEATAQAIFRDWFVDFGPTRAKMQGLPAYYISTVWDYFPNTLSDEGIPTGWRMGTVGECFRLTMGQSPPGSTYNDYGEGLPFFQGRSDFGFRYPENRIYCIAPNRIAETDDTLVSVRAPVGDINMAWEKCCVGRGVAVLQHTSGSRSFTYYSAWAKQAELKQYEHNGTVFGAINKKQFSTMKIVVPAPKVVALFERHVGSCDERIRHNVRESRTLAQLRDLLLPKLMSGEIRLRDAERAVEAVA